MGEFNSFPGAVAGLNKVKAIYSPVKTDRLWNQKHTGLQNPLDSSGHTLSSACVPKTLDSV